MTFCSFNILDFKKNNFDLGIMAFWTSDKITTKDNEMMSILNDFFLKVIKDENIAICQFVIVIAKEEIEAKIQHFIFLF